MRPSSRSRDRGLDEGFSLVELIVAMFVIAIILTSLAMVQTRAMVTIAQAKERQQATALANQTLEQLRALPWDTLKKGLSSSFPAASDPNVASGRLHPVAAPAIDELLAVSSSQLTNGNAAPLAFTGGTNVATIADAEALGYVFTVRSYVTYGPGGTNGPINLTVIASWNRRGDGRLRTVVARSTAYAPSGGCGGTENQPFLGACQAFYTSESGVGPATITITGTQPVPAGMSPDPTLLGPWPILNGLAEDDVMVALEALGSTASSEQSTTTKSFTVQSGLQTAAPGVPAVAVGMAQVALVASDDVSSTYPLNPASVTSLSAAASRTLSGSDAQITISAPSAVSTTARAGMTSGCATPGAGVACGRAEGAGGASIQATFTAGSDTVILARTVAGTGYAWSGRFIATPGAAVTGCTTLADTGCTASGSRHTLGTTTIGNGPAWDGEAAPSGLVTITGYAGEMRSEYGPAQLTVAPTKTRSGSIQWWNGTGYQTIALNATTDTSVILGTVTRTTGALTVRAVGSVNVLPTTVVRTNPNPSCQTAGCSLEVTMPAVTVAVTYTITGPSGVSAFTVTTSLGDLRSASSFKAAPLG